MRSKLISARVIFRILSAQNQEKDLVLYLQSSSDGFTLSSLALLHGSAELGSGKNILKIV